jgi:hypothetical protein
MNTIEELEARLETVNVERDDLKRRLLDMVLQRNNVRDKLDVCGLDLVMAKRERDEARAYAEERNDEANKLQHFLNMAATERDEVRVDAAMLEDRLSEARAEVERLTDERDELLVRVEDQGAELRATREAYNGARAEVERLRGVLHIVSLDEYESTSSASEKVHAHARQARAALNQTTSTQPSDAAHIASLENLFLKACQRAKRHEDAAKNAYRRGAEAMREACARVADAHCVPGTRDVIRALPISEEP